VVSRRSKSIDSASVRAYVDRDHDAARAGKRAYWRGLLERDGLRAAVAVTDQLRQWMKQTNPSWPTEQDREEDLETHRRVAQALALTAPSATAHGALAPRGRSKARGRSLVRVRRSGR